MWVEENRRFLGLHGHSVVTLIKWYWAWGVREAHGKFKTILKPRLTQCECKCIITHAQSIKGRLWLQMRLQSQADAVDKRGLLHFRVSRLSSPKWNLLISDSPWDLDICWCLTGVWSDKSHEDRQSGFSWQQSGASVPSMIVLIRSDSGGMKDVPWCDVTTDCPRSPGIWWPSAHVTRSVATNTNYQHLNVFISK